MKQKIALVKLSAIGDIIHASICVQLVRAHMPNAHITWVVDARFAQLVRACAGVDEVVELELKDRRYFSAFKALRTLGKFDIVIDLQGLVKSAIVSWLIGKSCGFSFKSAKEGIASLFYARKFVIDYNENVIMRNAYLTAFALGFSVSKEQIEQKAPCFKISSDTLPKKGDKKLVLIAPFASEPSKCYDKFRDVILGLCDDFSLLVCYSSKDEKTAATKLISGTKAQLLAPKSLSELASFISGCDLVIGNDSGVTHLAWAQNVASITLFGNRPSERNTFRTDKNLTLDAGKKVDARKIDKSDFSVCEIPAKNVIQSARGLL
ncbi:lipopolysaccharide heptosyltransferase I [Campylobacter sp. 19-13652]|uniref:lipopolysaccharide heptosyltransferase I n=1 Tax=Campylobacter sp. 19-13652 TaxID=2840180 RepID=UPI001C782058|nr:lipopolysaccharide heptosyltransferase I [Campylobacter sp. 19-13652]BCX80036.1 heptosyltransferase I [Campylobacter sp. 19-13652]